MIGLVTDRLKFRLWRESDFEIFTEYFLNEENAKYLGGVKSKEEAWRLMASYMGHYHLKGFGYLAIEERSTEKFVGCAGLWKSDPWPELELGYWLLDKMQGYGYATEAAKKVKDYAFQILDVKTLVSYIDPHNQPSINVALRLGASYEKDIELLDFGVHMVYRYTVDSLGNE